MVEQEVLAGLKNALDRGQPLEKAIQSLINAGYNPAEVRQAAQEASTSILHHISNSEEQEKIKEIPKKSFFSKQTPTSQETQHTYNKQTIEPRIDNAKPKRKIPRSVVILLTVLGVLLIITAGFMFFGKILLDILFPKV